MSSQAPIKVSGETKERIRYLAALTDTTQADIVDRAVSEYAIRHADVVAKGIGRAREVLAGDVAIAARLLGESPDAVSRCRRWTWTPLAHSEAHDLKPFHFTCRPVVSRLEERGRDVRLERGEEQVTKIRRDEGCVGAANAEGAPDLFDSLSFTNQDAIREPVAEVAALFRSLLREGEFEQPDQLGCQSSVQPDRSVGSVAEVIVGTRQERSVAWSAAK